MVDFVLKDDRVKTKGSDFNILSSMGVIGLNGDLVGPIGIAWMLLVNALAAFAACEVALSNGLGDDKRVNELILDELAFF